MIEAIRKYFRRSWLSCERFAERSSCKIDGPLKLQDKVGYLFHYFLCHTCRQVTRHWLSMQCQLKEFSDDSSLKDSVKLSEQRKDKIIEEINKVAR